MNAEDDMPAKGEAVMRQQANEALRQAILRCLMRLAGRNPNTLDHQSVLETFRFWKAGKEDLRRHGPPRKSECGEGLPIEELRTALVGFAKRRAGVPFDVDDWRGLARTLGSLRELELARSGPEPRRRPPANRFPLVVLTAHYTAPEMPGKKNPHAIASRMIEDDAYAMSLRKLEGLIGEILRSPKPQ
jgi:hypothetical protein